MQLININIWGVTTEHPHPTEQDFKDIIAEQTNKKLALRIKNFCMCYTKNCSPNHTLQITVQVLWNKIVLMFQEQHTSYVGKLHEAGDLLGDG
jgi:hypothetical protein